MTKTNAEKSSPSSQGNTNSDRAAAGSAPESGFADQHAAADLAGAIQTGPVVTAQRKQLQGAFGDVLQRQGAADGPPPNRTGLPDRLKSGIEGISGLSMDDVRVHYNSPKPAGLQALAYTHGAEIHVAPGQERHLPHEAWHVVQQKQGRVKPTMDLNGTSINDDSLLEREADENGATALQPGKVTQKKQGSLPGSMLSTSQRVVQRRVGFEFEDSSWKAWKNENPIRAANRKEELHVGTGYKLEGDDTPGDGTANIEWVTSPYPATNAGITALNTSMHEITAIYARLNNHRGHQPPDYVTHRQHRLSHNDVLLSGGSRHWPNGKLKMQATFGSSLSDLPTVMKYFGSNVPGETQPESDDRENARALMYGQPQHRRQIAGVIGNAPSLGEQVVTELQQSPGLSVPHQAALGGNTNSLTGLCSLLIMYLKMLQLPLPGPVKYRLPFLGRSNMAAIFAEIPANQQAVLAHNQAAYLKAALLAVSNANPLVQYQNAPVDANLAVNDPLIAGKVDLQTMTIGQWLEGLTTGTDYLYTVNMDVWLQTQGMPLGQRTDAVEDLESLAVINDQFGGTDNGLVVLENRGIDPNPDNILGPRLSIQEAHRMALNYLQFFVDISQGNIGAFPDQNVPAPPGRGCFITTACIQAKGLADDCVELTTLRAFRDQYIATLEKGKDMIKVYYENAPLIVEAINRREGAAEIYEGLYQVIRKCVRHILEEQYESAFQVYVNMVIKLRNEFIPMTNIPAFFYPQFEPGLRE